MVAVAECKSRMNLDQKAATKITVDVRDAVIDMLKFYAKDMHSITADNCSEFVDYQAIAEVLNTDVYFAHPYLSDPVHRIV